MCSGYTKFKNIAKYFVFLSWNNPLMLLGLKSVHLRIIQMYHFQLKWKRLLYARIGGTPNFFGLGLSLFPVGLLLFASWESWTPVFKILVRALGNNVNPLSVNQNSRCACANISLEDLFQWWTCFSDLLKMSCHFQMQCFIQLNII